MLALLLSVLVNVGWGQGSYTRVNYQFPNTPFINNEQYLPNDLVTIERRYIGLAANGYGQWAVINSTNQPLWALLGNASYDADAQSNPVKSSGMVGYGTLDDGDGFGANFEVKVAANLSGSVRYYLLIRPNQKFSIKWFN